MALLLTQKDDGEPLAYDLNAATHSIGRHPESFIVLGDASVSSHHAEIIAADGRYLLRDLQSSNGTKVNGVRITETTLKDGDNIFFGGVEFRFRGAPDAPQAYSATPGPAAEKKPPQALPSHRPPLAPLQREAFPPRKTSKAARSSLVYGILSVIFLPLGLLGFIFTIPALICGHIGRRNIRNANGALAGGGMALAGLIMGYASMVLAVVLGAMVSHNVQLRAANVQSLNNARMILIACDAYAFDHEKTFPPNLDALVPAYLSNRAILASKLSPQEAIGFYYYGGKFDDPPNKVVVMGKYKDKQGRRIIGHANGSAAFEIPPPDLAPPSGQ